jgi:hypothetical protein
MDTARTSKPFTTQDLLRCVQELNCSEALPSDDFLDIMEEIIADRRNHQPRDLVL